MSDTILRFDGVSRDFNSQKGFFGGKRTMRAVDSLTLDVPRGKVTGVVGESGCGKSTLARLALHLLKPTAGHVCFEGKDLAGLTPAALRRQRRHMQMVFQDPYSSINPRFTIRDAVMEPFQVHGVRHTRAEAKDKAARLLEMAGLDPQLAERYPQQLSGGQKQRVGIARALALEPDLIVLDEPTASLDVSIQAQIIALLADLKTRLGLTYLFISHDLGLVRYFCDRIVVMYLGAAVEILPSTDAPHRHPYTRTLMDSAFLPDPERRKTVTAMTGEIPSAFERPPGCAFAPRCSLASSRCYAEKPVLLTTERHPVACHHPLD